MEVSSLGNYRLAVGSAKSHDSSSAELKERSGLESPYVH